MADLECRHYCHDRSTELPIVVRSQCKKNNFELGVRVPFIVRVPWMRASLGQRTYHLAELVDL
eukprot:COSAG01_NODE_25054_length_757_cov_0.860182_3_plen_62_part_01